MKDLERKTSIVQFITVGIENPKLLNMLHKTDFHVVEVGGEICCPRDVLDKKILACDMTILLVNTGRMNNIKTASAAAEICKERTTLIVGLFTENDILNANVTALQDQLDTFIVIPFNTHDQPASVQYKAEISDDLLYLAVESIICFIRGTGNTDMICLDFTDVSSILKNAGLAYMATSSATGQMMAESAVKETILNLMMKTPINRAHKALVHITGSMSIKLEEIETVATLVYQTLHPNASLVFGASFDEEFENEIRVSVIITGLGDDS